MVTYTFYFGEDSNSLTYMMPGKVLITNIFTHQRYSEGRWLVSKGNVSFITLKQSIDKQQQ
jgi:hypothetical protein